MSKQGRSGLGLGDRLVLLVAWLVTSGLVYLLGFYVGKATPEGVKPDERVARLPVTSTPPPAGQRPKGETELTFYDALAGGQRSGSSDAPAEKSTPEAPAKDTEARLETPPPAARPTTTVPKEAALPPRTPPSTAARAAVPPPPAARPASPPPAVAAKPAPPPPAVAARPAPPAPPRAAAASPPPPPSARSAPPDFDDEIAPPVQRGSGAWSVLANPTRDRAEAEELVYRLKARGYDATLVHVAREGGTWYRVRVGRYWSEQRAGEIVRQLREREGVAHAFVAEE